MTAPARTLSMSRPLLLRVLRRRRRAPKPHRGAQACAAWASLTTLVLLAAAPTAARTEASTEVRGDKAAAASASADAAPLAADEASNLDRLRQRLAEKLGATAPEPRLNPSLMRVTTRADEGAKTSVAAPARGKRAVRPSEHPTSARASAHGGPGQGEALPPGSWSYEGARGPAHWAELDPANALCTSGRRQSPIDIRGGVAVELEPIRFDYRPSEFVVIDDGHTILARLAPGNTMAVGGRRFALRQMHFHHPAEERIDSRGFDMSLHLVHEDDEGRLAVLALLLQRGDEPQPVVQRVWNDLPLERGVEQPASQPIDPAALLPADRAYATYMGSLTTPPCSEDVLWLVMRQPLSVTQAQIDVFTHLYPMNARPLQSAAGRLIKQSR